MFLYRLVLVTIERGERVKKELLWESDRKLADEPPLEFFLKEGVLEEIDDSEPLDAVDEMELEAGPKLQYTYELEWADAKKKDWSLRDSFTMVKHSVEPMNEIDLDEELVEDLRIIDP